MFIIKCCIKGMIGFILFCTFTTWMEMYGPEKKQSQKKVKTYVEQVEKAPADPIRK